MTDEKHSKKLEQVRALLAKAESTTFPAEAEAFRAKADQIMSAYAIDQCMVEAAEAGRNTRSVPVKRMFDRSWRGSKFREDLFWMFQDLADHCRCVVGIRGADYRNHLMPVFGLDSDLDYLDALFTGLMLEVAKNLQPPVNADGDLGEEVFKQRQAGTPWPEITRKVYMAGLVKLTKGEFAKVKRFSGDALDGMDPEDVVWDDLNRYYTEEVRQSIKNRLANANRKYVKDNGLQGERNYVKPEVYQRSFMYGFRLEISSRLAAMSRASRTAWDDQHEAGSMALAVRDIKAQAMDLYEQEYPTPPPAPPVKGRKGRAVAVREVTIDYGAMGAGRKKASEANLSNNPSQRIGKDRKGLNG